MEIQVKTGGLLARLAVAGKQVMCNTLGIHRKFSKMGDTIAHLTESKVAYAATAKKVVHASAGATVSTHTKAAGKVLSSLALLAEGLVVTSVVLPVLGIVLVQHRSTMCSAFKKSARVVKRSLGKVAAELKKAPSKLDKRRKSILKDVEERGGFFRVANHFLTTGYLPSKRASILHANRFLNYLR